MDSLVGAAVVAHVLVRAAASMRTLTFQRPGEADRVAVELWDDVQGLSRHHRTDGGVIGVPEVLEWTAVSMSVERWRSHGASLVGPWTGCSRARARGRCASRTRRGAHVNHGMPEARQGAEGTDTVSLHLAQDLTEVHRGRGCHSISDFVKSDLVCV